MATTKIWSIKGNLGRVVDYAENPDKTGNPLFSTEDLQGLRDVMNYATQDYKTEKQHYVSGLNCEPEVARQQMLLTKQRWGKEDGIVAFHAYQSFLPGEVTPDLAHQLGVELAQALWGDRFEVIVATHLDKSHLHNHFVLNSVSFLDGKKYNDCKASYALMRQTSDRLCREHELSVIEQPERGRTASYDAWQAEQTGKPTWYGQMRADVDAAVSDAMNFSMFVENLRRQGYTVKQGKYLAVRAPGKERFTRLQTLGDSYTEDVIKRRIREGVMEPVPRSTPQPPRRHYRMLGKPKKLTGFRALYYHYLYFLGKVKRRQAPKKASRYLMDDVIKFDRYVAEYKLLQTYRIDTAQQLSTLEDAMQVEIDGLVAQRKALYKTHHADPTNSMCTDAIAGINQRVRQLRRDARLCGQVQEHIGELRKKSRNPYPIKPVVISEKERNRAHPRIRDDVQSRT